VWNNPTPDVPLMAYLGQPSVMSVLYANHAWASTSGDAANALNNDLFKPILSDMPTLLENYRVFIYNGNFDMVCGALGVERIYYNLEWAGQAAWQNASRSIWTTPLDNKGNFMYSGYVRQIEGFNVTQIIVAGAGHMVPMDQPVASLDMISRLVRGSWD
jgi:carboxypeptidase C (cathepsin A)